MLAVKRVVLQERRWIGTEVVQLKVALLARESLTGSVFFTATAGEDFRQSHFSQWVIRVRVVRDFCSRSRRLRWGWEFDLTSGGSSYFHRRRRPFHGGGCSSHFFNNILFLLWNQQLSCTSEKVKWWFGFGNQEYYLCLPQSGHFFLTPGERVVANNYEHVYH